MDKMEIRQKIIEKIDKVCSSLPSLSSITMKLMDMATDEDVTAQGLANLIEKDPSLTVKLLKLANSAYFSQRVKVASVEQAVMRLGFDRLRIMALSLSLRDTFPMGLVDGMDYESFWRLSLYRALIAQSLSVEMKKGDYGEVFVATLILDIGLLALHSLIKTTDWHVGLDLSCPEKLFKNEKNVLGIDHREIGRILLKKWKFPDRIVEVQSVEPVKSELGIVIGHAERLSRYLLCKEEAFEQLYKQKMDSLELNSEKITKVLIETFEHVDELAISFSLDIDSANDLFDLLSRANETLSLISTKLSSFPDERLSSFDSVGKEAGQKQTMEAVAHEIRNPLMAVGGFARRLVKNCDESSRTGQYAKVILKESIRLEQALEQMSC